jgi:molybdenum cofactor synthesis domain-containing protein
MLSSLCQKTVQKPIQQLITDDSISDLKKRISNSLMSADILITTGGVSVGKYDLTKAALTELGAEIFFERLRLKPGKPTVFARLKKTLVFGLPGNPVSAAVTFYLLVRRAILKMQSAGVTDLLHATAVTLDTVRAPKERDAYSPAAMSTDTRGRLLVKPLNWHGSSDFIGFARSEALIVVPRGKSFDQGECVRILFLR